MKNIYKLSLLAVMALGISISAQAQNLPEQGSFGLRASLVGQTAIEAPYMLNESLSLAPYLGFASIQDVSTNFTIGVQPRFYTQTSGALVPYITGSLAVDVTNMKPTDQTFTDILLGVGYGGEYFVSNNFSLSAQGGLNLVTGDSPTSFSTNARVSVSVYF